MISTQIVAVGTYEGEKLELGDGVGILVGAREGVGVG